jgi:hypothetical protein
MTRTMHGVIHGKRIELVEDPGIDDGEQVEVTLRARQLPGPPPGWSPGCKETAGGMLADVWTDEDDRILDQIYRERHHDGRPEIPE